MSLLLIAGTWFYTSFADSIRRQPAEIVPQIDDSRWTMKIERTFDCVPDPVSATTALSVKLKGETVFESTEAIPKSKELSINKLPDIERGRNDLFIQANVATLDDFEFSAEESPAALRVLLIRGTTTMLDRTFWLESGQTSIEELVDFQAPAGVAKDRDDQHDHESPLP